MSQLPPGLPAEIWSCRTVEYATTDGTATAGEDYVAETGTLTFAPGEVEKKVTVVIMNDNQWEPDEDFVSCSPPPLPARLAKTLPLSCVSTASTAG